MIALAFVPAAAVINDYELIAEVLSEHDAAEPLLNYFEKTCIGDPERREESKDRFLIINQLVSLGIGYKKLEFAIDLWNVRSRVSSKLLRSNNSIEDWHNALADRVGISLPKINNLANRIHLEQLKFEVDYAQIR